MPASRYFIDGRRIPGCTSAVVAQLGWSKRSLMAWANKIGREGIELNDYKKPAEIGTFAHAAVEADIKGEELDLSAIPTEDLEIVEDILGRWKEWREKNIAEVLLSEKELVSRKLRFGGRPDLVYRSPNGLVYLCDLKTGGVYAEHLVQVAAYAMLVEDSEENESGAAVSIPIDRISLLRIPQGRSSIQPAEWPWDRGSDEAETVRLCLKLYEIQKRLRREV